MSGLSQGGAHRRHLSSAGAAQRAPVKHCPADILALGRRAAGVGAAVKDCQVEPTVGPRHCWALLARGKQVRTGQKAVLEGAMFRGAYTGPGPALGSPSLLPLPSSLSPARVSVLPGSQSTCPARPAGRARRSVSLHAPRVHGHPGPAEALCQEVEGGWHA